MDSRALGRRKCLRELPTHRKETQIPPSSPPANRGCPKLVSMLSQYPPISQDGRFVDEAALERHMNTLKAEMRRESPRKGEIA